MSPGIRKTAIILAMVALALYFGFIFMATRGGA
jgi:hypothetical protein